MKTTNYKDIQNNNISATRINLYQSYGKSKVWRKKEFTHDPKHIYLLVKHSGGLVMS